MFHVIGRIQHESGKFRVLVSSDKNLEWCGITKEQALDLARRLIEAAHGTGVYSESEDKESIFPPQEPPGPVA